VLLANDCNTLLTLRGLLDNLDNLLGYMLSTLHVAPDDLMALDVASKHPKHGTG
jgi:hypothetical protein